MKALFVLLLIASFSTFAADTTLGVKADVEDCGAANGDTRSVKGTSVATEESATATSAVKN